MICFLHTHQIGIIGVKKLLKGMETNVVIAADTLIYTCTIW